jgi:L-iditol 2-dehydrogenase
MGVEEVESPVPEPGEALVRVTAAGVCGSDVHGFTGASGRRTPGMVMGHELAGVVEAPPTGAPGTAGSGQRVAVNPLVGCGSCPYCESGQAQICSNRRTLGVNTGLAGGFSEYVAAPAGNLEPLAEGVSPAEGALAEPLAVAVRAVGLSGLGPGEPTLVLGGGAIGLCILLVCRARGVGPVLLAERLPHRLEAARALGAWTPPADVEPARAALELTGGLGVACAFDAVAAAPTIRQALSATRRGGRVVLVGLAAPSLELPLYELVPQERTIQGSYAYTPEEYREAVRLINEREVDVRPLIERSVALDDATAAFRDLAAGRDQSVRVMVEPSRAESPGP